ncbi:MAG: POT family proton-dependent oligopeptide transporter [Sphingobacteriales bacterium]|jgi:POT family proton-dependent oligopeptide transporter
MTQRSELFGHPKGLYILFFTELWERFSYYGMRAILVLYIVSSASGLNPGLGWSNADALWLYGWYTMLVYVASIPGGYLADKFWGQKKAVLIGGILLCAGHMVLAIEQTWAFYTGLSLIILGVGGLKPNISTMVGGLYPQGDIRRDKGFTIFYIGINVGAFLSSIIVGYVGETIGWHYGFGLAGIGMILGQAVFMWGQKYLVGVGDYIGSKESGGAEVAKKPLTKIEKDRVIVLLISFLIIIVFWGAFEQAGGLMNIYAKEKIDRFIGNWEVPASVFQSVNAFFIITLGTLVAGYWAIRKIKGKESSSIFKMAIGTIIMGLGFLFMAKASIDVSGADSGKASMTFLILAYLFHTVGELCASPVALSFITKLAPVKYASIMMGVYFAATGFGNKLAGSIGEASQIEPVKVELTASGDQLSGLINNDALVNGDNFNLNGTIYLNGSDLILTNDRGDDLSTYISLSNENQARLSVMLKDEGASMNNQLHANIIMERGDVAEGDEVSLDQYSGEVVIEEVANAQELKTFLGITLITVLFGFLLILFLKKLKALTHGAEDEEGKASA